jgi:hypothetical protein
VIKPISKSQFTLGTQCQKAFYLYRYRSELREVTAQQEALFAQGRRFEPYMQQRFPGGVDVSTMSNFNQRFAQTAELIQKATSPIYEATLKAEFVGLPLLCMIDMLVPSPEGWHIYEIKSATKVKDEYIPDVAFQHFVAKLAGISIASANVIHLNNQYVRKGEIDITQLGTTAEITREVLAQQDEVAKKLLALKEVDELPFAPEQEIGAHCSNPYDCAFMNYCWQDVPKERSVFAYLPPTKAFELYHEGIKTIDAIPEGNPLAAKHALRLNQIKKDELFVDKPALTNWLAQLSYPIYYMDFETFMPAIPLFDESRPYQQIPFQFSVHVQHAVGAELIHHAFLAEADGTDPRPTFAKQLLGVIGPVGSIMVYNQSFEISRLKELARDFPEFETALLALIPSVVDLYVPFRDLTVYHPAMKGSASIKHVLPALVPELSYANMQIGAGGDAMTVFASMLAGVYAEEETATLRQALLAYCELDTRGMVELVGWLTKAKD